jgi:SAM-dependent methyltransferase
MSDDEQTPSQQPGAEPPSPDPETTPRDDRRSREYWNVFYSRSSAPLAPSQFAAFVANEYPDHPLIIDVGCGNGRDALFFMHLGYQTIAIDASDEAIRSIQTRMNRLELTGLARPTLINKDISDLAANPDERIGQIREKKKIVYARFFLHALTELQEDDFIRFVGCLCFHPEDVVAVEFRTDKDENIQKIVAKHFRRFINPEKLKAKMAAAGALRVTYEVEGTGLAKYKTEDAQVCRILFCMNGTQNHRAEALSKNSQ